MAAQRAERPPRPAVRPPRHVVLTCVARRDAAQRLSLAFSLLARASPTDQPSTIVAALPSAAPSSPSSEVAP